MRKANTCPEWVRLPCFWVNNALPHCYSAEQVDAVGLLPAENGAGQPLAPADDHSAEPHVFWALIGKQ